ncbi:DUF998 domain-containing protein, partial [Patescibacteria group bacterium]|nr:DUF998 domain-containing protein [Patescibacteria group bacterium]MBU1629976.1 DUF998 domain-containing protein [Patescibacteria group bacterium]MBU1907714.1 DUF998 domain-containing protein [Patescibacteria group bacterium]
NSPAAMLFNISMLLFGVSLAYTAIKLWKKQKPFALTLILTGLGFIGVGIFTGDFALAHIVVALLGLISGGVAMIASITVRKTLFEYFSVPLGVFSLVATFLFLSDLTFGIGIGGMERLAFYSILIWTSGFGGKQITE